MLGEVPELHQLQHLAGPRLAFFLGVVHHLQWQLHVLAHRAPLIQRGLLEHNAVVPIAAGLAAATGYFAFQETLILQSALDPFLTALGLWTLTRAWTEQRWQRFLLAWAVLGLLPVAGAGAAWWCLRRQHLAGLIGCVAVAAVLFLGPLGAWGSASVNRFKAPHALVRDAGACRRDLDLRIGAYYLEHLPSLNFYCQRNVKHHPDEAAVLDFLRTPLPVYLFVPAPVWQDLQGKVHSPHRVIARHHDLYRNWDVLVVTNR